MSFTEKLLNSHSLYEGTFVRFLLDTVQLPNGKEASRAVVRHPGAACVLAETEDARVVLVRQYRHACARELWEIPAGKLESGEDPAACAARELAEETPYTARALKPLYRFFTAPGFCDEELHLFEAQGVARNSRLDADEDEFVAAHTFSRDQIRTMLADGRICDAKSLIALLYWLNKTVD